MEGTFHNQPTLRLHVLASGSKGNAAVVEDARTGDGVLVDCGICKRDFLGRCAEAGFDVRRLRAVLVTHDHADHTKGLGVVMRGLAKLGAKPTLWTSEKVRDASAPVREAIDQGLCSFAPLRDGDVVCAGTMEVRTFATSHDAAESFGFRFECAGDALGFMTDTGVMPAAAREALADVRLLALEANHDAAMLREGPYPFPVKQRIASERGHLSNEQAAEALSSLLGGRLRAVVAMHVSQNNNTYEAAREALEAAVAAAGHDVRVLVAYQDRLVSV